MFDVNRLAAVKVGLASPERIREWSHGEVTKSETVNYRSQKPEMDGLFCERIFGPAKDYECHCGKYKKIRFAGITCERCGVEVTSKEVRRERMGHIELASPCTHIWYLRGIPSRIGLLLDLPEKALEEVVYFSAHIVLSPGSSKVLYYKEILDEKTARTEFTAAINEFLPALPLDSADYMKAQELIARMSNPQEAFDFLDSAAFISRHTGAEFGDGAAAVKRLLKEVHLNEEFQKLAAELKDASDQKKAKIFKRLEVVEAFRNGDNKPEWMVLDCIPVIPPDLRPMLPLDGGRNAVSDINELYRRVINRNNRLKKLININAPAVILNNEKRMVQEAVDALIDNGHSRNKPVVGVGGRQYKSLSSSLKGKQGRFRQNLLGKRVDYSGRSVIAVGPDLKMYECGIPREMAIQLLRPYIAHVLIKKGYVNAHKAADKIIDQYDPIVYDIVEDLIDDHPVLLNRAPTLHRLGIQAFKAKLVDGRAIRLHPLVCAGFNADFDGDQMAVHLPLSKAAQEEALDRMLASNNILGPKDGKPIATPSQDMVLGNYYLTLEETKKALLERAARRKKSGDLEQAALFTTYGNAEGKVFADVDEVILAYETKQVHLHTRIAVRGSGIFKKDGATNLVDGPDYISEKEFRSQYLVTTVGKIIFNLIFPSDFPFLNDMDRPAGLKGNLREYFVKAEDLVGKGLAGYLEEKPLRRSFKSKDLAVIIDEVYHRYGTSKTSAVLDKLKDQGFKYSTVAGFTISLSDIHIVKGKEEILADGDRQVARIEEYYARGLLSATERHDKIIDVWKKAREAVTKLLLNDFNRDIRNPLFMISDSGARGKIDNIVQLAGMRGLMVNPTGGTIEIPIKSCFREGQSVSEFFIATHGARKGGADTALKTADSGYLTRRLVDVSQDVIVREEDCHTDHGFVVHDIIDTGKALGGSGEGAIITTLYERLVGRFSLRAIVDPKTGEVLCPPNTLIDEETADRIVKAGIKEVEIRSLFGCETKNGVCVHCYGRNLATGKLVEKGEAVGIMAAQSIGEPGTQLTLRTFHSGGIAQSDITEGLPRVQELVEARPPKGEALISEITGEVSRIEEAGGRYKIYVKNDLEERDYTSTYGARLAVKVGDRVINGGPLTEGSINPKKLLEVSDARAVEEYMLNEIQKPYRVNAGIGISDKHIEVIVRQMLRKVLVLDSGDTDIVPGTKLDVDDFTSKNEQALAQGRRPAVARQLILGITKSALEVKSFLSAASFQETTRVLTDAAVKAKRDNLHGLKENVITGKLIPAGTGLFTPAEEEKRLAGFSVREKMREVMDTYVEEHDKIGVKP